MEDIVEELKKEVDKLRDAVINFNDFLEGIIRATEREINHTRSVISDNEEELINCSRNEKREYKKGIEKNKKIYNIYLDHIKHLCNLRNSLSDPNILLTEDDEFKRLLYVVTLYRLFYKDDIKPDYPKKVFTYYVFKSKVANQNCHFLDYFDDHGVMLTEKILELKGEIEKYVLPFPLKIINKQEITSNLCVDTIISEEDIKEANELLKEKKMLDKMMELLVDIDMFDSIVSITEANKKAKQIILTADSLVKYANENGDPNLLELSEEVKEKAIEITSDYLNELEEKKKKDEALKLQKRKEEALRKKSTDIHRNNSEKAKLTSKYFNSKNELKPEVVDDRSITIEQLQNDLTKLGFNKNEINNFIEKYNEYVCDKKIKKIFRLFKKHETNRLKMVIPDDYYSNEKCKRIKDYILDDSFDKKNDKQIKEEVSKIIEESIVKNNTIENLIIFSEEDLLAKDKKIVNDAKYGDKDKDEAIKGINTHLVTLQNTSIDALKASKDNAFHELWIKEKKEFIINDRLKWYRYGARKIKVILASLSVTEENNKRLEQKYGMNINNIVLIFGTGSVIIEDEQEMYSRIKKYGFDNADKLSEIYDIFANPFTDETFKTACDLIDNSFDQLNGFNNKKLILK